MAPDHKTFADFRRDNGAAIRKVCAQFVALCRAIGLLTTASVAIDGSKFKAVNNRDKNFTRAADFVDRPRFITITEQSAPSRRIGTFGLAVCAACAFSLGITV